jgi:uncharacterized protein with beta-barrel porin domain
MSSSESHIGTGQNRRPGGCLPQRYFQLPISFPKNIVGLGSRRVLFIGASLVALCIGSERSHAAGGNGGQSFFQSEAPGIGGSGPNGGAGTAGGTDSFFGEGAGGGGGGAGGGNGGAGGAGTVPGALGGSGGTSGFPSGSPGNNTSTTGNEGAGGGGGGFNGFNGTFLNGLGVITGGSGGAGGNSVGNPGFGHGGGGGGGEGGYGANVTSTGGSYISGTVTGGTGGKGGDSDTGLGGNGGDGGIGVFFGVPGVTLFNVGTIQGGHGGALGSAFFGNGLNGAGGAGVVGAGLDITNVGAIRGGLAGDGVTRANAITFTGGVNALELQAGWSITGNVVAFSALDALRLGAGVGPLTFDTSLIGPAAQFQGFGVFQKISSNNTWTLIGTPGSNTPWFIDDGTLAAGAATNVFGATSAITVNSGGSVDIHGFNQQIGSLTGNGTVTNNGVGSPATLTTGADNTSTTFAGLLTDGSHKLGLTKIGNGNFILSGVNTYTGPTTVNAGILSVNGSIASSSLTVNAGGTLGGNGTVGNTSVNGGTVAPGNNSIGLLTVKGIAFTAAASYMVDVSPSNADRINASGTATLGGATVNASFAPGAYASKQYTIVSAPLGGVSGTFGALVNTNLPTNFQSSLSYDANDVYLNLALTFPSSGLNVNQRNVANAIAGFFNANPTTPMVFSGLTPAGLSQVSGELATGSQQTTFDAMNLFIGLLTDPFVAGRGNAVTSSTGASHFAEEEDYVYAYAPNGTRRTNSERDAYAAMHRKALPPVLDPFTQRWSVWAAGYGGSQTTDGNATLGSNTATSRIYGTAVGADYRISPFTIAGFALAGGGTNFTVNGSGSGRSDLFQAGAFLRHNVGPAYISAALAYGWQDITTDRTVTVAGIDQLRAKFNANAWSGRVEGGYRFVTPWMGMGITPYAAGQFTTYSLPAYAEQVLSGASTFALTYGAKDVTASRSELGLRSDRSFVMQDGIFTLRGRAAWAHNFNSDRSILATFQTLPGASFVVNGAGQAHDSALTTASAEMKWLNGWSAAATFEGEFSGVTRSYAGKGVVRYAW